MEEYYTLHILKLSKLVHVFLTSGKVSNNSILNNYVWEYDYLIVFFIMNYDYWLIRILKYRELEWTVFMAINFF